jgi:hypothetical protein
MLVTVMLIQLIGLVGLFVGPPVTIALQILGGQLLYSSSRDARYDPVPDLGELRQRLADVRTHLDQAEEGRTLTLKNILHRLERLLEDSREAIEPSASGNPRANGTLHPSTPPDEPASQDIDSCGTVQRAGKCH